MRVALWDSHRHTVEIDFAGGSSLPGETLLGRIYRGAAHQIFPLDRHPVPIELAYLAAVLRRLHHAVEYFEDEPPVGDVVVLRPTLKSIQPALEAIDEVHRRTPQARCWVIGPVASRWPHWFTVQGATVLKGDVEQLLWNFDRVLACDNRVIHLGYVDDLDTLPWPEWSWFEPDRFRLSNCVGAFPVGQVQHSRPAGGQAASNAISSPEALRYRSAERVVSELRQQIESCGFEAFVFCDPRFAAHRQQAWRLVQLLGRLPQRIEFAIQCRPEDMSDDLLAALADVGLSTAAFQVALPRGESSADASVEQYAGFVARCRRRGVRTLALFEWPGDARPTSYDRRVAAATRQINATLANFSWLPRTDATVEEAHGFSLGWVNRYYLRLNYAWQQWRLLTSRGEGASPSPSPLEVPHADAAHIDTPKPLGGLDLIQRTHGLRKDAPHQRAPVRRNHDPSRPHD